MTPRKRAVSGSVLLAIALAGAALWRHPLGLPLQTIQPLPPLETSLWYWHETFNIPEKEAAELKTMGVNEIFVRCATFGVRDGRLALILPEQWKHGSPGLPVTLVLNFNYDVVHQFEHLSNAAMARAIVEAAARERTQAEAINVKVTGLQLDLDSPTRLLPKYADLLHQIRPGLKGLTLSVTALPTRFQHGAAQPLVEAVDFTAPQFYEGSIPTRLDHYLPISQLSSVAPGIRQVDSFGRPFYVGCPVYGHALVYNDQGSIMGAWHDMSLMEAARSPAFHLERAFGAGPDGAPATAATFNGEEIYQFAASMPTADGQRKLYHFVYDIPTPVLLAQHLAVIRAHRPANCRGVILFQYPEEESAETLSMTGIASVLHHEPAEPKLDLQVKSSPVPWDAIEDAKSKGPMPVDVMITVKNSGSAATFLATDGVTLTLALDRPGVEDVSPGGFDLMESFTQRGSDCLKSSLQRADLLKFHLLRMEPGETVRIGPIRLPGGPTGMHTQWTARCPGGFRTVENPV